ncbi:Esterase FE4 [Eumeta japonica]|uniref:Esterase FE4 n=1 Tax=Eumeta variegata TaxID=151549 RepID=A0A4C1V0F4_EUMVA|nr:Esterase FE4 [Eumeta japonica]
MEMFLICLLVVSPCLLSAFGDEILDVTLPQGVVRGHKHATLDIYEFHGIHYATEPTGRDKFKAPLPAPSWEGIFDAVEGLIMCPQPPSFQSEQCLRVNVFVPVNRQDGTLKPVIVVIHGGSFVNGFGNMYLPHHLVQRGIIAVTFNYRMGSHGFLCLNTENIPGNAGLKDQLAALKWVKENIQAFGGNPDDITLAGYSAGAASAEIMMLSPAADGLFHKVILESGSGISSWAVNPNAPELAKNIAIANGASDVDDITNLENFYLSLSYQELLRLASVGELLFTPCVDVDIDNNEVIVKELPYKNLISGNYNKLPMLTGYTDAEGVLFYGYREILMAQMNEDFKYALPSHFSSYAATSEEEAVEMLKNFYFDVEVIDYDSIRNFTDYYTDGQFSYWVVESARQNALNSAPVYLYEYTYVTSEAELTGPGLGATHCAQTDLIFISFSASENYTERDLIVQNRLVTMWSDFVKFGEPVPQSSPDYWEALDAERMNYLVIGFELENKTFPIPERLQLWDKICVGLVTFEVTFASWAPACACPYHTFPRAYDLHSGRTAPARPAPLPAGSTEGLSHIRITVRYNTNRPSNDLYRDHKVCVLAPEGKLDAGTVTEIENGTDIETECGTAIRMKSVVGIVIRNSAGTRNAGTRLGLAARSFNIKYEGTHSAPLPAPSWEGIFDAVEGLIMCPQPPSFQSEQCLRVNVFVPGNRQNGALKPVLVVIHGGAFVNGFGNALLPYHVVERDIIVVTFNYRLGPHGFLCLNTENIPGNAGLKDQLVALKWIKQNIQAFGGNPDDITLGGHSAGAASAEIMMLSPAADGLFHKIILESGSGIGSWAVNPKGPELAKNIAIANGANNVDDDITNLENFYLSLSYQELLRLASVGELLFTPCVDVDIDNNEVIVKELPYKNLISGNYTKLPMLTGYTDAEGLLFYGYREILMAQMNEDFKNALPPHFASYANINEEEAVEILRNFYFEVEIIDYNSIRNFTDYYTDGEFYYWVVESARQNALNSAPVYLYEYTYVTSEAELTGPGLGATHCAQTDLIFISFRTSENYTERDLIVQDRLVTMWSNFVKFGEPVPQGSPDYWEALDAERMNYLVIGFDLENKTFPTPERLQLWDKIWLKDDTDFANTLHFHILLLSLAVIILMI